MVSYSVHRARGTQDAAPASDFPYASIHREISVHDEARVSDHVEAVLLKLGPATVRASATMELHVTGAPQTALRDRAKAPEASSTGEAGRRGVDVGLTREGWLLATTSAMGGVSQIVAPGNTTVGLIGLLVGYLWGLWRWSQRA